jgi:hypothetical protein
MISLLYGDEDDLGGSAIALETRNKEAKNSSIEASSMG